jgi:hypothetical protein
MGAEARQKSSRSVSPPGSPSFDSSSLLLAPLKRRVGCGNLDGRRRRRTSSIAPARSSSQLGRGSPSRCPARVPALSSSFPSQRIIRVTKASSVKWLTLQPAQYHLLLLCQLQSRLGSLVLDSTVSGCRDVARFRAGTLLYTSSSCCSATTPQAVLGKTDKYRRNLGRCRGPRCIAAGFEQCRSDFRKFLFIVGTAVDRCDRHPLSQSSRLLSLFLLSGVFILIIRRGHSSHRHVVFW